MVTVMVNNVNLAQPSAIIRLVLYPLSTRHMIGDMVLDFYKALLAKGLKEGNLYLY